ncbi:hypothetical protein [Lentzea sp. NPDC004782]|uniref:hypothetical protein n=1 Tax=Lentzea sp. NPDC004782 TaxID=3154458 RepID=UPI0033BCDBEA
MRVVVSTRRPPAGEGGAGAKPGAAERTPTAPRPGTTVTVLAFSGIVVSLMQSLVIR